MEVISRSTPEKLEEGKVNRFFVVFLSALAIVAIIGGSYVLGQNSSKPQEVKAAAATTGQTQQAAPDNPRPAGDGGGAQPTVVSTSTATPAPQPTATVVPPQAKSTQCLEWNTFVAQTQDISNPYKLIDWLDQRPEKVNHPQGGYTLSPGVYVMWTGLYVQDTNLGGMVSPFRVDGKTGVWIVNTSQNLVVPTPGGTICITGFNGSASPAPAVSPVASACVDKNQVVAIINNNKASNPNQIYVLLDQLVDNNPAARLRASGPAVEPAKNSRTLFWVRNGNIAGNVLALDSTEGKTLYLATSDGDVNVTFAHSGVQVCGPISPEKDFPWWGKN